MLFEFFGGVLLLLLQIAGGDDWLELLGFELWERGASKVACFLDKGTRRRSGATGSGGEEDCAMLLFFGEKAIVLCRCLHVSGWTMEN